MNNYRIKLDENGYPINEAIDGFDRVDVPMSLGEHTIEIPEKSYGFLLKRLDIDASVEVSVNNDPFIPADEGDHFSPMRNLNRVRVKVDTVGTNPIVLVFIR